VEHSFLVHLHVRVRQGTGRQAGRHDTQLQTGRRTGGKGSVTGCGVMSTSKGLPGLAQQLAEHLDGVTPAQGQALESCRGFQDRGT
jgi:hypothetical protein